MHTSIHVFMWFSLSFTFFLSLSLSLSVFLQYMPKLNVQTSVQSVKTIMKINLDLQAKNRRKTARTALIPTARTLTVPSMNMNIINLCIVHVCIFTVYTWQCKMVENHVTIYLTNHCQCASVCCIDVCNNNVSLWEI